MSLSPRTRADYLLLYPTPTPRQCLEAYATAEGVEFCKPFPNILAKAQTQYPQLREIIASHMPHELIAHCVCAALDGVEVDTSEIPLPKNLLDE